MKDRFHYLNESSMVGYWRSRISDGLILDVNKSILYHLGYNNTDDVIGKLSIADFYSKDDRKKIISLLRTQGEITNYEVKMNLPQSSVEYVLISAQIFPEQGYIEGISVDITDWKKAEKRLKKSERKYRNLVEDISDGLIIVDLGKNVIFANAAACEILSYPRESLIGMNLNDLVADDDWNPVVNSIQKLLENKGNKYNLSIRSGNDKIKQIQFSVSPYLGENDNISGGIIIFSDTTNANKINEERKQLQIQLEKARRMESIGILAGGVAHDLNNILGPLVAYPEMILMKLEQDSPVRKKIEMMGNCARDAADVIQDLLTLARRGRYEMVPTDLNEVIESYLASASMADLQMKNPNIEVKINLDRSVNTITGSTPHLLKMIMNLIVNAFDAMSDNGTLSIETSEQYMENLPGDGERMDKGDYLILKITDTGTGIDKKYIKRIFEPYFSKKEMGVSGSGLGLSVVYGILKDHQGYYDIISKPGEGTQFLLYFPVTRELVEIEPNDTNEYRGTEKILIVDDSHNQRQIAHDLLKEKGYLAESVSNGHEAIELLKKNEYDLILLDMIMEKDFDGLDTYKEIKKIREDQKVIIISGYSATSRVNKVLKLGAGQYLKKPYTCIELTRMIRKELDEVPIGAST
ncbi:MAG: response regulator [Candidatus Zixiibacteriota bacterium]